MLLIRERPLLRGHSCGEVSVDGKPKLFDSQEIWNRRDVMKRTTVPILFAMFAASICGLAGCREKEANAAAEAPPPAKVVGDVDVSSWAVSDPSKYPLFAAQEFETPSKLQVTGAVTPTSQEPYL
jgi:hypothetical protein